MTPESPFAASDRLFLEVQKHIQPGTDYQLGPKGVTVAHFSITDTPLAACCVTMGIPLRDKAPFTDDAGVDVRGNEIGQRKAWWIGDSDPTNAWKTEEIAEAWYSRQEFEPANLDHPLTHMRAGIDARTYWIDVLHAYKAHRAVLPIAPPRPESAYVTESLHGASVLKACGFQPVAFNRGGFFLERIHRRVDAQTKLIEAAQAEGRTPPMWMARVLTNLSAMLKHVRASSIIIRQELEANTVLLLSSEASGKTRDKFLALT